MSENSKRTSGVKGGYSGRESMPKIIRFAGQGFLGQDSISPRLEHRANQVSQNVRAETSDTLKRRKVGFRGI